MQRPRPAMRKPVVSRNQPGRNGRWITIARSILKWPGIPLSDKSSLDLDGEYERAGVQEALD